MTATEALAKALETNWWGLNGHIGQEAADKLRTALQSEGYTIVPSEEIERLRAALGIIATQYPAVDDNGVQGRAIPVSARNIARFALEGANRGIEE